MLASPVLAQLVCAPRSELVEKLERDYAEAPVEHGLTNPNDQLLELFMSKGGKTWTLLLTFPNGHSCFIGVGRNWRTMQPKLLEPTGLVI